MRRINFLLSTLAVLALSLAASERILAASPSKITWHSSLRKAGQESIQTGKPVLIQFTATWCGYCHKMLETTYHDASVIQKVNEFFVPVLLDADENEKLVKLLKVKSFPTTVIISTEQEVLLLFSGYYKTAAFTRKVSPLCKKPVAKQVAAVQTEASAREKATKPTPKLAFNGLCLVTMLDERKWVAGTDQFTSELRGVKLHFATAENKAKFLKTPSKYWPLADGVCPVASTRDETSSLGDPQTAAVFRDQLIFFKSVEHRQEFAKNPQGFMTQVIAQQRDAQKVVR
jgi:thiol-disulfide isomerase/thioredoxin